MAQSDGAAATAAQTVEYGAQFGKTAGAADYIEQEGPKWRLTAMMDAKEILKFLPHRYPFLLVDRILEIDGDRKIVGIKNVSFNENFFQGHFPNKPVMPGVLICEAMAQVGAIFAHNARGGMEENKVFVLTGLDKVKFKKPVEPGDQLRIEITCVKRRGPFWKLQGMASVDGKLAAQAEISAMEIELS